jgi:hypothetical protein
MNKMLWAASAVALVSLVACGGGGGSSNKPDAGQTFDGGDDIDGGQVGAPVLTVIRAYTAPDAAAPLTLEVEGTDADGDASKIRISFLDDAGNLIEIGSNGETALDFDPLVPFGTDTSFSGRLSFNLSVDLIAMFHTARISVLDLAGNESNSLDQVIIKDTIINGVGGTCNTGSNFCDPELTCVSMVCEQSAAGAAACAAADALTPITTDTTTTVNITEGAGSFQGSCFFEPGHNETILVVELATDQFVTVETTTPDNLDSYIYFRTDCASSLSEAGCNDDIDVNANNFRSRLAQVMSAGTYYLYIDGSSIASDGSLIATGDIGVSITFDNLIAAGAACNPTTDHCVSGNSCYDPAGGTSGTCLTDAQIIGAICAAAPTILPNVPKNGTLPKTGTGHFDGSCAFDPNQHFEEDLYKFTLAARSEVTLSTDNGTTAFDSLLYVEEGCANNAEPANACHDDVDGGAGNFKSTVVVKLDAGNYTAVVDRGFTPGQDEVDPTPYQLTYTVKPVVAAGGVCDPTGTANVCDDGLTCTAGTCQ